MLSTSILNDLLSSSEGLSLDSVTRFSFQLLSFSVGLLKKEIFSCRPILFLVGIILSPHLNVPGFSQSEKQKRPTHRPHTQQLDGAASHRTGHSGPRGRYIPYSLSLGILFIHFSGIIYTFLNFFF